MAGQPSVVDLRNKTVTQVNVFKDPKGNLRYIALADSKRVLGGRVPVDDYLQLFVWDQAQQEPAAVADTISKMSVELLLGAKEGAKTTQKRMASTFNSYLLMLWLLFVFGFVALGFAAIRGYTADTAEELVTTAIFAGLSATTFVATFLLRPTGQMADAGPRAAWAQALVTTFWTKLGYMYDANKALEQLDAAQTSMQRAMLSYLGSSTRAQREWADELHRKEPDKKTTKKGDKQDQAPAPAGANGTSSQKQTGPQVRDSGAPRDSDSADSGTSNTGKTE